MNRIDRDVIQGVAVATLVLITGVGVTSYATAGPGSGNPACTQQGTTVAACSKVDDSGSCDDDFISDGDCPSLVYSTSGLNSVHNVSVECE